MSFKPFSLASVATFRDLPPEALRSLEDRLQPVPVRRGDCVVRQGENADALHVVVSGRFAVEIDGDEEPVAEISHGSTIGEIAFFAGGPRTATVRAIRDGVVVRLTRDDFNSISETSPAIWAAITSTLAERLAAETRRRADLHRDGHFATARSRPRTIAVVGTCDGHIPEEFLRDFAKAAGAHSGTIVVSSDTLGDVLVRRVNDDHDLTEALNALESRHSTIVFIADRELTAWSEKSVRQADELLLTATSEDGPVGSAIPLGALEEFALSLHRPQSRRLAIVHRRRGVVQGTRHWLSGRAPAMHHHIALGDTNDIARLWRFLVGEALGFVACGGGAYCAAHVGIYRAFRETGVGFDYMGGTSGGAAIPRSLMELFEKQYGVRIIQGWGMTETSPVGGMAHPPTDVEPGTAEELDWRLKSGRLISGVQMRIVSDQGEELPWDGEAVGEIEVRGPWITGAYYRADVPEKFDDGWLRTGDIGTIDDRGFYQITDRSKDVIKSGGEWISSVELENLLAAAPGVAEVAVIGIPDEKWTERPLACVVRAQGADVTPADLAAFLVGKVAGWQIPENWTFVDEVPKTTVGKFDKKVLRAQQAAGELRVDQATLDDAFVALTGHSAEK